MSMRADWMWMDGEFVPWDEAKVHVFAHALHYGSSVFEGIRAYATPQGPAVFRLHEHMVRFVNSARIMRIDLPYTVEELEQAVLETIAKNKLDACYIRPLAFRGYERLGLDGRGCPVHVIIGTVPWGTYLGEEALTQGVDVMVSSWRRYAPNTAASVAKIGGQYVNSQFSAMEAHDLGYHEAIVLDVYGYVAEGSGENIFMVKDGKIYTPPVYQSILPGITRDSVMTLARDLGYEVYEQPISRDMLYIADELFFTGTAAEITPIRSVDRIPIGSGSRGPITKRLQEEFFAIVRGEKPDRHGWLRFVYESVPAPEGG